VILTGLAFVVVFGLAILVAGIKRLFAGQKQSSAAQDILWGSVGVAVGLAMILGGAYLAWALWTQSAEKARRHYRP
jgi:hypothetical protein